MDRDSCCIDVVRVEGAADGFRAVGATAVCAVYPVRGCLLWCWC